MTKAVSGAEVCGLLGLFGITLWAGTVAVIAAAATRRQCCPPWCPCRAEEDYLDCASDGNSMSPTSSIWRPTMPIQRGDEQGNGSHST